MKKEAWVHPVTMVQQFAANEYVAACGKRDGKYIFTCDAPAGTLYYYNGSKATELGRFTPCDATHETDTPDNYRNGFVDYNKNGRQDDGESVLVWLEYTTGFFGGTRIADAHASKSLTMSQIEVDRS